MHSKTPLTESIPLSTSNLSRNPDNEDDNSIPPKVPQPSSDNAEKSSIFLNLAPLLKTSCRYLFLTSTIFYILNQKKLLPKPISAIVSKALFWPTLPLTVSNRIGQWMTDDIDEMIILGGAPFGFCQIPQRLYEEYGVRSVINMCAEYRGPVKQYKELGMKQLWLKTVDHFEPSFEDLKTAVEFIQENKEYNNGRVYIHCRAGHGRSSAIAIAWLVYQYPNEELKVLNDYLLSKRRVRSYLWTQPNVIKFRNWVRSKIGEGESIFDDTDDDATATTAQTDFSDTDIDNDDEDEEL